MVGSRLLLNSSTALAIVLGAVLVSPAHAGSAQVKAAQEMLAKLGYDPGEADGAWGGKSRVALNAFQKDQGFKPTRKLGNGTALALELVANGAEKAVLPVAERVGNTLVLDVGARVYYSPAGKKVVRLPNGKNLNAKWRKKADGTYCEYVFSIKKEDCRNEFEAKFIIYKDNGKWTYFEKSGKKKYGIKMVEGDHLKP